MPGTKWEIMRLSQIFICLMLLPLAACATVDLADMTPAARVDVKPAPENVVIRTSEALVAKFDDKGWSAAPDPNRMQKAAGFLLRGMKKETSAQDVSYSAIVKKPAKLRSDILSAAKDVTQAAKAADVYLAVAKADDDLRMELKSLEKTLAACHKAEAMFMKSLETLNVGTDGLELAAFKGATVQLRDLTNVYGQRVRASTARLFEAGS